MNYVNHRKVKISKWNSEIHFLIFFYKFAIIFFSCVCIKMSKILSAKYYQENKDRLQKKACERYQNLSKEEEEKMAIWS